MTDEKRVEMSVVFAGRPVAWDRPARGRRGKGKTREKQLHHRQALAKAIQFAPDARAFEGPVELELVFDYVMNQTCITIREAPEIYGRAWKKGFGRYMRPDIDNLTKQVMEAAQDAGVVKDDVQFVSTTTVKIG